MLPSVIRSNICAQKGGTAHVNDANLLCPPLIRTGLFKACAKAAGEDNLWLPNVMGSEIIKIYFLLRLDIRTVTVMKQHQISLEKKMEGGLIPSLSVYISEMSLASPLTITYLFIQKTLTDDLLCERHKLSEIEHGSKMLQTDWCFIFSPLQVKVSIILTTHNCWVFFVCNFSPLTSLRTGFYFSLVLTKLPSVFVEEGPTKYRPLIVPSQRKLLSWWLCKKDQVEPQQL